MTQRGAELAGDPLGVSLFLGLLVGLALRQRDIRRQVGDEDTRKTLSSAPAPASSSAPALASSSALPCKPRPPPGKLLANKHIDKIYLHEITSLREHFASEDKNVEDSSKLEYNQVLGDEDFILSDIVSSGSRTTSSSEAFVRAGPRGRTHFNPVKVRAAIVTCGGLCPGLNNVIREVVHALTYLYKAESILGIKGGFNGFSGRPGYEPIKLDLAAVSLCHHQGGTILASSRGGFDLDVIVAFLKKHRIDQLYVIGGDGTHRGANAIADTCLANKLNIAVVGIPKTIDNDVDLIDRSFGFTTSVEAAQQSIVSAKTEAKCNMPNGIGIVKLMGRSAGFIAAHAALASGDVDLCLVPECRIELEGENGCLPFLMQRVKENGHAVIVVAEGAGEELLGSSAEVDAGGNRKLPAIGDLMKRKIVEYWKAHDSEATVKYIDPSYMIRSIPANSSDSLYCMLLGQNAVHGAMAGYTAFSVGLVNNRVVYIPITRLVATSPRKMDPFGRTWERILAMTRQPAMEASFDPQSQSVCGRTI